MVDALPVLTHLISQDTSRVPTYGTGSLYIPGYGLRKWRDMEHIAMPAEGYVRLAEDTRVLLNYISRIRDTVVGWHRWAESSTLCLRRGHPKLDRIFSLNTVYAVLQAWWTHLSIALSARDNAFEINRLAIAAMEAFQLYESAFAGFCRLRK